MKKTIVVWCGALICCALWGSAFPFIKLGYSALSIDASNTATQLLFAGIRFTLSGILTIILGSILNQRFLIPKVSSIPRILWLCMFQTVIQYFFFYVGLAHTSGVKASIIEGTNVFVSIIVSALIFRMEDLSSRKMIGCVIGFAGVVLINLAGSGLDLHLAWNGEGFIFFSTIGYALSSVYLKRFSNTESPVLLSGYQFLAGGIILAVIGYSSGGRIPNWTRTGLFILLWLSFVSAIAYSLWATLLKYNPVSRVSVFGFMNPVFGVILSAIFLKENNTLGLTAIISLLLVCAGIYICNSTTKKVETP